MSKKLKTESLSVGSRVRHVTDKNLTEGVVVWKQSCTKAVGSRDVVGRRWSVHWSNGDRGIYRSVDISKIPPKNLKKIILKEIEKEDEEVNEEE